MSSAKLPRAEETRCECRRLLPIRILSSCVYIRQFHPGSSSFFPLRDFFSRAFPPALRFLSSPEASPCGFPVRGGGSRRGSPNCSGKLGEITIIIIGVARARRYVAWLLSFLASLPSSSECFLPFSFSSISSATCFGIRRKFTVQQIEDPALLNCWLAEEFNDSKTGTLISAFIEAQILLGATGFLRAQKLVSKIQS